MSNSNHFENVETRFAHLESTREYRRVEGTEVIPVEELPVFVRLGQAALNTLVILNTSTDLTEAERSVWSRTLNPFIETYIIDPKTYDLFDNRGYKALRSGETVLFGRAVQEDLPRSNEFSDIVSRRHATIGKTPDGKSIIITDLASINGTYLATSPVTQSVTEAVTEEYIAPTDKLSNKELVMSNAQGFSLASERHPDTNEDKLIVDKENNIYAVLDGVGGHEGGDIASEAAKNYISQRAGNVGISGGLQAVEADLRQLLVDANDRILALSSEAATTAVLAKIHEISGELYASIAHVGDSRAYLLHDGLLQALTVDHTLFRYRMGTGDAFLQQERLAATESLDILSYEDVAAFQQRNVIGANLGRDSQVHADIKHFNVMRGDAIILTSDGVHDNLTTQEMQRVLVDARDDNYSELLVHAAKKRSRQPHVRAKMDDMTAVVVNI